MNLRALHGCCRCCWRLLAAGGRRRRGGRPGIAARVTVTTDPGGGQTYSLTLQVLILMTVLTLLPAILLMMTAFTRIIIVLSILRQAIGAGRRRPTRCWSGSRCSSRCSSWRR